MSCFQSISGVLNAYPSATDLASCSVLTPTTDYYWLDSALEQTSSVLSTADTAGILALVAAAMATSFAFRFLRDMILNRY